MLRQSALLPDEVFGGYLPQFRQENFARNVREFSEWLGVGGPACLGPSNVTPFIRGVLQGLRMDSASVVCGHSFVPFTKLVAHFDAGAANVPTFSDAAYLKYASWCGRIAKFCRQCVAEDLLEIGWTYWRRMHQLPGVTWCTRHWIPLSVSKHYLAFDQSPEQALNLAEDFPAQEVIGALSCDVVRRYAALLEAVLSSVSRPVHSSHAGNVIRVLAAERGLKVSPHSGGPFLSDEAYKRLPAQWTAVHFPASLSKRPGEFATWIDQAGHARTKPVASATFALALALLSEDHFEALKMFCSPPSDLPRQRSVQVNRSTEELRKVWLACRGSYARIAETSGASLTWVRSHFGRAGLPAIREKTFARAEAAWLAHAAGVSRTFVLEVAGDARWAWELLCKVRVAEE